MLQIVKVADRRAATTGHYKSIRLQVGGGGGGVSDWMKGIWGVIEFLEDDEYFDDICFDSKLSR